MGKPTPHGSVVTCSTAHGCLVILENWLRPPLLYSTSQKSQKANIIEKAAVSFFGQQFVKRFALCYRTVVLSLLSVCDVGVL